ncbi:beta-ketoacyl-[acyl-carrier-protein] synthase family protein [Alteromonas sp. 1_MG-2023]|uniref:beta-ketoacyl-[acyl-carrier-protein] synthase family protein n=1 Tax=Alteromonas sp. 1_MG-2023 TaxID=3062669 RepID=UPI0026E29936|nr:beta-ketoacyl-[acyl-carrier-protein] synthase family protein [Alteromonas sp. 1_MG-2023]MDO6566963.1 beta-ketoacyl-[acyl-carrier-protein] synthase family protein [Alteromonas sp. 1_MG-2023]
MIQESCYLNALGIVCAAGNNGEQVKNNIQSGNVNLVQTDQYHTGFNVPLGLINAELPLLPLEHKKWQSRNNQCAMAALQQIRAEVDTAIAQYGAHRVAVIIGTSTSGIAESEQAIRQWVNDGTVPDSYDYGLQEMGAPAQFIAEVVGAKGPAYGISTACSSGAKALATARRLISADLCDAVIAGGVDTMCQLTVQGFQSLQAVSDSICNPFSVNRKGINIGEGAALFLVSKQKHGVKLVGTGESSDAHHISAPDPEGKGAIKCIENALQDGQLQPHQIDYINLHGTATELNDQMESTAVNTVFGADVLCSSTKPFTGHTLGAAGAVEAGICWLMLVDDTTQPFMPLHIWDSQSDPALAPLNFVDTVESSRATNSAPNYVLSNSFAFGGNNISLILGRI